MINDYEKQVYAGVLGKIIGVYAGRPFEGRSKAGIEEKWGFMDRYVHEDVDVPLVVADDDISGTLTFVRALEDSGKYADTPVEFFGDTWLNYLVEGLTVLWWGGMGNSTEHTAYLRLKRGIKAPHSGSIATNGKTVAEQIGAQIFIDAFGMVAPGRPELAADLARRSASVSHDGEAVNGAIVVAGMVSAAFVEKEMDRILDAGVALVPSDSLIAEVHRDVRGWAKRDNDWRKTYDRIDRKYGYDKYGGNCHMIPNHAIMVMAWAYGRDDFHRAMSIICTAGWDTDCNAGNVGSVMGVKVGLERICEKYDYHSPFADRIVLPTAEGSRGVTDALNEAMHIARIGRRVMGWDDAPASKEGAWHHFSMPGALHGYMSEEDRFESRGAARVSNIAAGGDGDRAMRIEFDIGGRKVARVSTPIMHRSGPGGGYSLAATPRLYTGMSATVKAAAGDVTGAPTARLFVRHKDEAGNDSLSYGGPTALATGGAATLSLAVPDTGGRPVLEFGIEVSCETRASGTLTVDRVVILGRPRLSYPPQLPQEGNTLLGWISGAQRIRGPFSDDKEKQTRVGKDEGRGLLVTGTTDWDDYTFEARLGIHLAELGGILVRYQGLERYIALVKKGDALQLVLRHYGDRVLSEVPCTWEVDELHQLKLVCNGQTITAYLDGAQVMEATDDVLGRGGAGIVFESGLIGFRDVRVN